MDVLSTVNVNAFLERALDAQNNGKPAARNRGIEITAAEWQAAGLLPGDIVFVMLASGATALHQFFAIAAAGGVPALVPSRLPTARVADMVTAFGARAVVMPANAAVSLPPARPMAVGGHRVLVCPRRLAPQAVQGEVLLLTSGTSGGRSACVFDLAALLRTAARHASSIGQRADDTVLVTLPLHSSFALVAQVLATLISGGTIVIGESPFHLAAYDRALTRHNVTITSLVPSLIRPLARAGYHWPSSVRVLTVGGDRLYPEEVPRLLAAGPRELYLTYGLTEAGPRVSTLAAHREPASRWASVGQPLPDTYVSLRDVADGVGDLLVTSDAVMKRRIGARDELRQDWAAPRVVATGDAFRIDADGYLYFQARRSDIVIVRGEKICLASIRSVAATLPGVRAAVTELHGEGETRGFDLTLILEQPRDGAEDWTRLVRQQLSPAEWPRRLLVQQASEAEPTK